MITSETPLAWHSPAGYDSRHLVALLRAVGAKPYLYVYGPPDAADVKVAKVIAEGEGFTLHHEDKRLQVQVEPDRFREIVAEQFHLHDGQGLYGAFGNGSDLATRRLRTQTAQLHINGSCGEIYRNVFSSAQLPDAPRNVREGATTGRTGRFSLMDSTVASTLVT